MARFQYAILALGGIALIALGLILFFQKKEEARPLRVHLTPHVYGNPQKSIERIQLKVVYAVPKNRRAEVSSAWKESIEAILPGVEDFHELQFIGLSAITPSLYPEPLILKEENFFYDTESTDKGNPEALRRIVPEIEERLAEFIKVSENEFRVIGVIYEGVGASGSEGALLLSRIFLTEREYEPIRASLFYHEFGHSIGLPDRYDRETSIAHDEDIMGSGRRKPIDRTYIDRELLKEMGVVPKDL